MQELESKMKKQQNFYYKGLNAMESNPRRQLSLVINYYFDVPELKQS